MELNQILCDVYDEPAAAHAKVGADDMGISVEIDGFGNANGANETVLIELAHGVPQVVIWADKDKEDPTHIISLAGAKLEEEHATAESTRSDWD
jgi:hypothetical protein